MEAETMLKIDDYLRLMVEKKASDLHLASGTTPKFRIAGEVVAISDEPLPADAVRALIDPILPERNRLEWDKCHDTDFAYEIEGVARYRCNVFADRNGIGGVFRL